MRHRSQSHRQTAYVAAVQHMMVAYAGKDQMESHYRGYACCIVSPPTLQILPLNQPWLRLHAPMKLMSLPTVYKHVLYFDYTAIHTSHMTHGIHKYCMNVNGCRCCLQGCPLRQVNLSMLHWILRPTATPLQHPLLSPDKKEKPQGSENSGKQLSRMQR